MLAIMRGNDVSGDIAEVPGASVYLRYRNGSRASFTSKIQLIN